MNKTFLTRIALGLSGLFVAGQASAQTQPLHGGQIQTNLVPARFLVNSPAAIAGSSKITIADWGTQPTVPIIDTVVKGIDSLASSPLTNGAALAGKFALIYRGSNTFLDKAQKAQAAGASGIIIVNNVPGDAVGMATNAGTTVSIPVVMVTAAQGAAINAQLTAGQRVIVTLSRWSNGSVNDLGILSGYASMPHALNVPLSMFSNSQNVPAYKNWVGGALINYGSGSHTNVSVQDSIVWVPTTGSPSPVRNNTYTVASIVPSDSVQFGFGNAASSYYLTPQSVTGRYDYYTKINNYTDSTPSDNINMFSQYITDSIFCKGAYDYANKQPMSSIGIQPASSGSPFLMGPMYFVTRGGYAARKVQFALSKNNVTNMDGIEASASLFKWTDGLASTGGTVDSVMASGELELVGVAAKTLSLTDSSGDFISLDFSDPNGSSNPVILDSNSWYWVVVQSPSDCFVAVDRTTSYFTRSYVESHNGVPEYPEGFFAGGVGDLQSDNFQIANFPFGGNATDIDSTFFDRYEQIPSVALHLSKNRAPVGIAGVKNNLIGEFNVFPNPASGSFNVSVKLTKSVATVNYRLMDNVGRYITDIVHHNVQNETFSVDAKNLSSGMYYLLINDGTGAMVKKITIK